MFAPEPAQASALPWVSSVTTSRWVYVLDEIPAARFVDWMNALSGPVPLTGTHWPFDSIVPGPQLAEPLLTHCEPWCVVPVPHTAPNSTTHWLFSSAVPVPQVTPELPVATHWLPM